MKGRSCLSNLLESIDAVNDLLAEGGCADILYFDFSKAFDSVPHHRLLVKLRNIGVPGAAGQPAQFPRILTLLAIMSFKFDKRL